MLADFQAHLAAIIESSDDAIVSKTVEGVVTSWNAAATRLFGYSSLEAIGQPITLIIPPELQHEERDLLAKIRRGERVEHYETVRVSKSGRRIHVSLSISPVRDSTGKIVAAAKIARDITASKSAEQALKDEAHALSTLNQVARTVAGELDLQRLVQNVTDAATELSTAAFGAFFYNMRNDDGESYTLYALSGAPRAAFANFPLPRNTAVFGPTFRGEGVVRCDDVTLDPRYGHSKPYFGMPPGHLPVRSYLAVPVMSRSGEVLGGLFFGHPEPGVFSERSERLMLGIAAQAGIGIDNARLYQSAQNEIAERRRVEEALRRSERLYRAVGESIDYGIWVCDAEGRNIYASESFLKLVGRTQEQVSEFGWTGVLHPDDAEATREAWQNCVRTGAFWDMEHRFLGADGQYHSVLARGVPVRDEQDNIMRWVGINLDVTRLKQAEEELRGADRRKDEFLAILAHELRNPLAPIRYALAIAKQPGSTRAQQQHAEEVVERQVEHMSRLLEDLLDVSRFTHGTLELRKSRIEIASAVTAAMESSRPFLEAKRHEVSVDLPAEPMQVDADPIRIVQILANLLINAAKYTDPGGQITLKAWREQQSIVISVRDNGIGIAPEMQPRLFTLFSQARPALERSEGGLGIGLALVQGLLSLHGGTIEARSAGRMLGSEFIVRLPASTGPAEVPAPLEVEESPMSTTRLRVLVADDNLDSAKLSATLIGLWGHEAYQAHAGRDALELAERYRPDVALLDIGMPDLDGYQVAAAIRKAAWGHPMLLIAVTGWGREEDKQRALSAGFDHHLTKPIDPAKLEALLLTVEHRSARAVAP
jgi:PAS domain S-box-containing protein